MTPETPKKLNELSAKELKAIAKNANLEFDGMANVAQMLEVLAKAGITEVPTTPYASTDGADGSDTGADADPTPDNTADDADKSDAPADDEDEDEAETPKKVDKTRLVYTVVSNIRRNGKDYAPKSKIQFESYTPEIAELLASNVIK